MTIWGKKVGEVTGNEQWQAEDKVEQTKGNLKQGRREAEGRVQEEVGLVSDGFPTERVGGARHMWARGLSSAHTP